MADFNITLRVEAPDLCLALNNLANAMSFPVKPSAGFSAAAEPVNAPVADPVPVEVNSTFKLNEAMQFSSEAVPAPTNPATTDPAPGTVVPAPAPAPAPVPAPAPAPAPVATGKVYSYDDIVSAGGQMLAAGKMEQLMAVLKQNHGVEAVTQLKPEQYPAVMADLIAMGAKV